MTRSDEDESEPDADEPESLDDPEDESDDLAPAGSLSFLAAPSLEEPLRLSFR